MAELLPVYFSLALVIRLAGVVLLYDLGEYGSFLVFLTLCRKDVVNQRENYPLTSHIALISLYIDFVLFYDVLQ